LVTLLVINSDLIDLDERLFITFSSVVCTALQCI